MRLRRRLATRTVPPRFTAVTVAAAILIAVATILLTLQGSNSQADVGALPAADSGSNQYDGTRPQGAADASGNVSAAGPLTQLDKDLLVAVRRAGLWELPAGRLAQTNASSEAVKRAGLHLMDGHSKLDQMVREDAKILGVEIPNEATEEQQGWVEEMRNAKGAEFDRIFTNLLRAAHGKVFATIAQARGATQNDLIRRHAREANQTVLDHLEVLEDTGLVTPETFADVEKTVVPPK
ncbi:DUF4142 domain-containing protein [Streptomyces sp. 549]|uniref:DUF4142 domain-containing protein n=1 Tax=Streptomyces sp. 549 TaxID=3049076 RepID=UPI0024C3458D|nr:DUF4142 domain-containing protein [Streptomyces sp. 549]MDK1473506.1 DUF4142 domain-containing protein [Streptomyces sp. 549]